jgi:hypothetical protein
MIILCNDQGLLAEAMYFVSGQEFKRRTTLLLPPRLTGLNLSDLGVTSRPYSSFEELLELIDKDTPDIVFLISGYLLVQQGLMSASELRRFIEHAQQRGCRVVTSDPLAGIMSSALINSASSSPKIDPGKDYSERESSILSIFIEPYQSLKHLDHIYPWACDVAATEHHTNFGFYNPSAQVRRGTSESRDILRSRLGASFSVPYWFFTLGPEDYMEQRKEPGLDRLVTLTAEKIQWILDLGPNVVLVGPDDFIHSLESVLPAPKGLSMFSYLPYVEFNAINLNAEYAFYWNVISASAVFRILHGLPTFHFSIGHIGLSLFPVYREVTRLLFPDCEPIIIDQARPFDIGRIRRLGDQARDNVKKIYESLEPLPTPGELVGRLMNR